MNVNLPVEANDFVRSLVAQGKYQAEEDAVVDGIRLLKGRDRDLEYVGTYGHLPTQSKWRLPTRLDARTVRLLHCQISDRDS